MNGIAQTPIEGVSMRYAFGDAAAPDRRTTQYFEMFCNRGIYHEGWTAVTRHSTPWVVTELPPFADDVWELYDTTTDWSQSHDLAAEMPEKLEELKELWLTEARKYNVLPLDDRRMERFNSDIAGRPVLVKGNSQLLFGGMGRLSENSVINVKNKSHSVTAEIEVPDAGANGVLIAQGGAFAGWSLYVKDGRPKYAYNFLGLQTFTVEGDSALPSGTHQVRMEFAYDGGGLAKGGGVTLYVDGETCSEGRSVELAERYLQPGQRAEHTIQTNGTLLDEEWATFFREQGFLVGLSIDGPRELHDVFRVNKGGRGSFDEVVRGLGHLRDAGVEWNALTTIHAANADYGGEVYRFLRDECGARFMQFIPIIERVAEATEDGKVPWASWRDRPLYVQEGEHVTGRLVTAEQYGRFLIDVFEEWVRRDVGEVYVQMFDVTLANWVGEPPSLCVHSETCGLALALEHTGDLYSCDHFVRGHSGDELRQLAGECCELLAAVERP